MTRRLSDAARLADAALHALVGVSELPLVLGMLHCLRGECDVFNGDPKAGVVDTQILALYLDRQ